MTSKPGPRTDRLMTTEDVAAYLQVSVPQVATMIRRGELPARKIARSWRVRPADLEAYVDAQPGNDLAVELARE